VSVGVFEAVACVGGEDGGGPVSIVEVAPDGGDWFAAWEEAEGEQAAPGPGLGGEADDARKDDVSHRGRALAAVAEFLKTSEGRRFLLLQQPLA